LRKLYETCDPDQFFGEFIGLLRFPISGATDRSPYIDKTLEFVAKFGCSFLEKKNDMAEADRSVDEEEEELPLFLYRLFAWLLDHHEVEGADARLRVCQLLNKLLKYMGEDACIDDELYNKIYDGMLERLKDKVAEIRSQAVTALQRLQDPKDDQCPIIKAYLFHLAHDPNNIVRRTIVRCIGATKLTLPHVLERTRDTDEHVRRAAYKFIAEKVHIKSLTIGQREGVLKRGLGDRSETVRRVVEQEMVPAWLRLSGNNILQLLHHLDVANAAEEETKATPVAALNVIFKDSSYRDLVTNFQYLDQDRLIPADKLTPETAMYWRVLAEYLAEQTGAEDCLEEILPELTPFCKYVRKFIFEQGQEGEDGNREFVTRELVKMTNIYDLGDEVGRRNLTVLVKDILISDRCKVSLVSSLVIVFIRLEPNVQSRIEQVAELIAELRDPLIGYSGRPVSHSPPPAAEQRCHTEQLIKEKKLAVARLRVEMHEMKDELDQAVEEQNFLSAQEIKGRMDSLEEQQAVLEDELEAVKQLPTGVGLGNPQTAAANQLDLLDGEDRSMDDPTVTLKCLTLLVSIMQDARLTQLNNTLHTLLEEFVTAAVQSEQPVIRKKAICALTCCCLRSLESARQHMLLLLQAAHIDVDEVRIMSISSVVDLLMKYGLASFITAEEAAPLDRSGDSPTKAGETSIDNAMDSELAGRGATLTQSELNLQGGNSVVAILSKFLDEPNLEVRTEVVEGLCKLLTTGSISSPKLLSRLLLIWYNPMTESDSMLRHILGTFFPIYCSLSVGNQTAMQEAFIPTMKTIFQAPVTSPLAEIDTEDVGIFFVHLTRPDMLQSFDGEKGGSESSTATPHDSLALQVCNQILSVPDGYQTKVMIKILSSLSLTYNNFVQLRVLKVLSENLLRTVKERNLVKSLQKFDKQLKDWLEKEPTQENGGASKRRNEDGEDDSIVERSLSPSRGRKRALFSQTLSNTIPLQCTPVRPNNAPTVTASSMSAEKTFDSNDATVGGISDDTNDETLVQEQWDEDKSRMAREETEIIASKKLPIIELESAESDEEEPQTISKGKGVKMKNVELVPGEVLADTDEDDLFSDVSSITSASISRIPRVDTSTESGEEETDDDATPKLKEKIISNAKAKDFLSSTQLTNRSVSPSPASGSDPKIADVFRSGRNNRTGQNVESESAAKESRKRNKMPATAGSDNSSTNSPKSKKSAHDRKQAEKKKSVKNKGMVNFLDESEDSIDSNPPVAAKKSPK